jgi:hypothetical protein
LPGGRLQRLAGALERLFEFLHCGIQRGGQGLLGQLREARQRTLDHAVHVAAGALDTAVECLQLLVDDGAQAFFALLHRADEH